MGLLSVYPAAGAVVLNASSPASFADPNVPFDDEEEQAPEAAIEKAIPIAKRRERITASSRGSR